MPASTANDARTPTLPDARIHHTARMAHDSREPAKETGGSPTAALSMNIAALRIASSSARLHNAAGATGPAARNSNSGRLASTTRPVPDPGVNARPARLARIGAASVTRPNAAYTATA